MTGIITENSKLFKALEKELNKKISYITEGEDEDAIWFEDETSTACAIRVIFDEQIEINITILDNYLHPVQEINLTL